jgi:hypothetical protein
MMISTVIYGALFFIFLYVMIRDLYTVIYTPGTPTLYNSPIAQRLFPNATNKIDPLWGYNSLGMYSGDPTKYGQGSFYPRSGKGYVPNKYGSGGMDPSGGERKGGDGSGIPSEVNVGWWNGEIEQPQRTIQTIYDQGEASIPEPKIANIGWWGYTL